MTLLYPIVVEALAVLAGISKRQTVEEIAKRDAHLARDVPCVPQVRA